MASIESDNYICVQYYVHALVLYIQYCIIVLVTF